MARRFPAPRVDPRVIALVEKAKELHPKLFGTEGLNISANKGPNGEKGYSIFHNKGTGHSYAIVAIDECLYLCFQVSHSAQKNKAVKVAEFYKKYKEVFKGKQIVKTPWSHHIDGRKNTCWGVDVINWQDENIIDYMIKLVK